MARIAGWGALLSLAMALGSAAHAQPREREAYCRWDDSVTEARLAVTDGLLHVEGSAEADAALAEHLPTGMPARVGAAGEHEHLLAQPHFVTWYDDDLRSPLWAAYYFPGDEADDSLHREDSFRSDPRLTEDTRADCADFSEPIFDQGHIVPRAAMNRSIEAMDATFLMSNMTPQHCAFNRGPWQVLEATIREEWAQDAAHTWVIVGTIYDRDGDDVRDGNDDAWRMEGRRGRRVAIPSEQYMIVSRLGATGLETLTVILPNTDDLIADEAVVDYLADHVATLDDVGAQAGFRFFDGVAVTEASTLWPIDDFEPRVLSWGCNDTYPEQ